MSIKKFTIGSDPEFVVVNEGGIPTSSIGRIGGKKGNPVMIGGGFGIEEDNVMAEATIPPCNTKEEFINNIGHVKQELNKILAEHGLHIESMSSARYSEEDLNHKDAQKFGCEPSFCVYTRETSPRPTPEEVGNLRSAGTHIHIGADRLLRIGEVERLIHAMDIFLGVPSLLIDTDTDRRKLYGNAGDMRFRNVGGENMITVVEYRTLGGYMSRSPELLGWIYDQTVRAVDYFNNNDNYELDMTIQEIIDTNNIDAAIEHCKNIGIEVPELNVVTVNV